MIINALDAAEISEEALYENYSGRDMFGEKCFGPRRGAELAPAVTRTTRQPRRFQRRGYVTSGRPCGVRRITTRRCRTPQTSAGNHGNMLAIEIGSIADYLAALGGMAAFLVALLLYYGQRKAWAEETNDRGAERTDREMTQARLVSITPNKYQATSGKIGFTLSNHSTAPVFTVNAGYRRRDGEPVTAADLPPDQKCAWGDDFSEGRLDPGDHPWYLVIDPSHFQEQHDYANVMLTVEFTDARGLRWRRYRYDQPIRILESPIHSPATSVDPPKSNRWRRLSSFLLSAKVCRRRS